MKKRAVDLYSSSPSASRSATPPPASYGGADRSRTKPAARTRSSGHEFNANYSADSEPFSGRLRKRSSAVHSYEELSDIDSDDDKGSSRRRKVGLNAIIFIFIRQTSIGVSEMSPDFAVLLLGKTKAQS